MTVWIIEVWPGLLLTRYIEGVDFDLTASAAMGGMGGARL